MFRDGGDRKPSGTINWDSWSWGGDENDLITLVNVLFDQILSELLILPFAFSVK